LLPALKFFGFDCSSETVGALQRDCECLVLLNIDCDFAGALSAVPDLAAHFAAAAGEIGTKTALHDALAYSVLAALLPDPRVTLPIALPSSFTAIVDDAKLGVVGGWTSAEATALFERFDAGLAEDQFRMGGCALDLIFGAFLEPDAFRRSDGNSFREWFLRDRPQPLLVEEVWRFFATGAEHHFANVSRLLDPYRSDGWEAAFHFFTNLNKEFGRRPTVTNIAESCARILKGGTVQSMFVVPHVMDGKKIKHIPTDKPWLAGVGHWIWRGTVFGFPPATAVLLRELEFLGRFSFIDPLINFVWCLREHFSTAPAVLGAILSCCSLFGEERPLLQELPLGREFGRFEVPPGLTKAHSAFEQIPVLIAAFLRGYNRFVDRLGELGCAVTKVSYDSIVPHMIVTVERVRTWLAATAIATATSINAVPSDVKTILRFEKVPLCSFALPESGGKDFFGFSEEEWRRAFASPPREHRIMLDSEGQVCYPGKSLVLEGADKWSTDAIEQKWTTLICLTYLYWGGDGEFPIEDFIADGLTVDKFLNAPHPDQKIVFSRSPKSMSGPLGELMPDRLKDLVFTRE
jgi:hypothetical protein